MKSVLFREVAFYWSPDTRRERSLDPNNPIWLLNCVSEMYSTALRLNKVKSQGVRKLNILLGDVEDSQWSQPDGGICEVKIKDRLPSIDLSNGKLVNLCALDMTDRAVGLLVSSGAVHERDAALASEYVVSNGFMHEYPIGKRIAFEARQRGAVQLVARSYFDHVVLVAQAWVGRTLVNEQCLFKSWPSAELLALSVVSIHLSSDGALRILLRDGVPSYMNVVRFGVSKVDFDGFSGGHANYRQLDERSARIDVCIDVSGLL